jgi:Spy/CpxP family protein refolding chaperone
MKTTNFLLKGIILTILFSLFLMDGSAQNRNEGKAIKQNPHEQTTAPIPPIAPPPPPPPPDVDQDNMRPLLNLPDLTDEQKAKIKKADLKQLEAMIPLRNQMREKKIHLSAILTTIPVDIKSADQFADEIGKVTASILKLQLRHDQELRSLLTPDQQIIFDSDPKPFLGKQR